MLAGATTRRPVQARATYLTPAPAATMDELPYPNFDDYFAQAETYQLLDHMKVMLPFETSRGCWWGERHHCTFCGLNGMTMKFRHKSSARAIDELKYLVSRYGNRIRYLAAADNILPNELFQRFCSFIRRSWESMCSMKQSVRICAKKQVGGLRMRQSQIDPNRASKASERPG